MSYTSEELLEVFKAVQNKQNWKYPIKAVIPATEFDKVNEAIWHFTGAPCFKKVDVGQGQVEIEARGYYSVMGA